MLLATIGLMAVLNQDLEESRVPDSDPISSWLPVAPARPIQPLALQGVGGAVAATALQNRWTLLTLGFTHCVDSCPMALHTVWTLLQEQRLHHPHNRPLQVWFVSIDPQRDSLSRLQTFMQDYSLPVGGPTIEPLRGELPQLRRLSTLLGAKFHYPKWRDGAEYPVEHTPDIYLINPAGMLVARFPQPFSSSALLEGLQKHGWHASPYEDTPVKHNHQM
uniref:Electron transport protein SCO1/SenC n=1 Tax=Magnetococcus massalia (strain MO-1) TaxID=451514 RepID=A0A1S7LEI3_MAGMO|nr:protein of unknown function. putative uncharacterized secreted protein of SCO1/SenC/PrrC family protein [Candidatus Magnetococcus massalia]